MPRCGAVLALGLASACAAGAPPPPLPAAFAVRFDEAFAGFPAAPSTGAWFYSSARDAWRAEHDYPQVNNFCACVSSSNASCALIFPSASAGMYVDYPSDPSACCQLCTAADGCDALRRDWLSGNPARTPAGDVEVRGRSAALWCVPGDSASADCMAYDAAGAGPDACGGEAGFPCLYAETFNMSGTIITHNLTFDPGTVVIGEPDASRFALRDECRKPCPRLFPSQCG